MTRSRQITSAARAATTIDAPRIAVPLSMQEGDALVALSTRQAWRWWLPPALLALLFTLLFIDPFAGDWDALDYTVNSIAGVPSSMLFGRMLFIFTNHAAYRLARALFNLQNDQAYLLFKYMVVAQCPLAIVACWRLARELSGSLQTATVAALMLALSPFFIVYSGQAMTETPSILLLCLALVTHLRGVRGRSMWRMLMGAGLLGLCVNIREPVGFFGVWLIIAPACYNWKFKGRELLLTALACLIFLICALAPFATWWLLNVDGYRYAWYGWVESMRRESAVHPVRLRNIIPFLGFFFVAAPIVFAALPFAVRREWRERGLTPLLSMALVGLFVNFVLLANYSTAINGRYLLTGLPALVPLTADYLLRRRTAHTENLRRAFVYTCTIIVSVALVTGLITYALTRQTLSHHAITKDYGTRLLMLPPDAVVMAGGQSVAVNYYRSLGDGQWEIIGTGGGWPGAQLIPLIEGYLQANRRVFVDVDSRLWAMNKWREQETRALVSLGTRFRFRRISDTIYEIRPLADESANDNPNWQTLLNQPTSPFR